MRTDHRRRSSSTRSRRSRRRLDEALGTLRDALAEAESPALAQIARRAGELRVELLAVTAMKEPSRVYFAELRGRGVFLRAAPIDVAEELVERLYSPRGHGRLHERHAGARRDGSTSSGARSGSTAELLEVEEARFDGPFDYSRQAALVLPGGAPRAERPGLHRPPRRRDPGADRDHRRAGLRALHLEPQHARAPRRVAATCPYQLLIQGERPKTRLLEAFRAEPSVLFATQSFWEGVDVPGDALSLVVIDRLPFAPPNDPVVAARVKALEDAGEERLRGAPSPGGGARPAPGVRPAHPHA